MIYSREEETDKQELVGEDSDPAGEIKPEKQTHFTDFECKVENSFMMWGENVQCLFRMWKVVPSCADCVLKV
jgi:hypothetical protein